jgi:hypothetical protein
MHHKATSSDDGTGLELTERRNLWRVSEFPQIKMKDKGGGHTARNVSKYRVTTRYLVKAKHELPLHGYKKLPSLCLPCKLIYRDAN